jgi:hypothetical protein
MAQVLDRVLLGAKIALNVLPRLVGGVLMHLRAVKPSERLRKSKKAPLMTAKS